MLKTLFYEVICARVVGNFASWLAEIGYTEESTLILVAMLSWAEKQKSQLTITRANGNDQR